MLKCREYFSCKFWVRRGTACHLKSSMGKPYSSSVAQYGPRCCISNGSLAAAADVHSDNVADLNADGSSGTYRVPSHWSLW